MSCQHQSGYLMMCVRVHEKRKHHQLPMTRLLQLGADTLVSEHPGASIIEFNVLRFIRFFQELSHLGEICCIVCHNTYGAATNIFFSLLDKNSYKL